MRTNSSKLDSSARPSFLRRRPTGVLLAAAAIGSIALSCSGVDKSLSDSAAVVADGARSTPQEAPFSARGAGSAIARDESRGVMGSTGATLGKVAPEATQELSAVGVPAPAPIPPTSASVPFQSVSQPSTTSSMIIRTGYAGIEVDSLETAIARVRDLAQRVGGFVANTAVQGGKDQLRSASLEVKVPSDRFDDALAGLRPIGNVESVNVNAQDVGEEYVDIAARVENAQKLEARLITLLANRTGKLQDVLAVERELARVREEIERYEGRLRYLRSRVALSTLTINVHERAPIIVPVAGDGPIVHAFRQAWRNFVGLVAGLIASLGVLIPLGVMAFVGWLVVRRWAPWRGINGTPPASGEVSGD